MTTSVNKAEPVLKGLDSESRQMVIETVRQLKNRLLTREKILEYDKNEFFPEEAIREMLGPDIGLQLLFISEDFGGMGGGARDCCAVIREMCKICLGIGTAFFAIQLGAEPIIVGGTEEQKTKWLGKISEGNCLVAYAVTEPGAGSNLAALKTNAFFVVEKGTPGFVQGRGEEKHGIRTSNTSPLSFTDVFVPAENLIGEVPGMGMKQAGKVFGYTRLMVAAMALGPCEAALEIVIPYAKERIQFGSPLSEKQGYTHKLVVPHAVRLQAATAYMDEIAIRLDSGESDLHVEGSIAKLFATESANKAADDAIQALGGYGYIAEFEVEKIKRDVKITCIYEGTSEIQQSIISTFRWKATRKTKGEFYKTIRQEMEKLDSAVDDAGCRFYGLAAGVLNETVMLAHDNRLIRLQHVMFTLADMMTHVEVGASMARKAVALTKAGDSEAENFKAMSRIFADEVVQLVSRNALKVLMGSGVFDQKAAHDFMETNSYSQLVCSSLNVINDMDLVADILFAR